MHVAEKRDELLDQVKKDFVCVKHHRKKEGVNDVW